MTAKKNAERCSFCHHVWVRHVLRREGTECGVCGATECWTPKTGKACAGCGHFEVMHFVNGLCRLVGCECGEFS